MTPHRGWCASSTRCYSFTSTRTCAILVHDGLQRGEQLDLDRALRDQQERLAVEAEAAKMQAVNAALAGLDDGRHVRFLDVGPDFLSPEGDLSPDLMPDLLHLSEAGYRLLACSLLDPLTKLLAEDR